MAKHWFWLVALIAVMLFSQAVHAPASAESPTSPGYALGACAPGEQVGHLTFSTAAPSAPAGTVPAAGCAWASTYEEEVVCLINQTRRDAGLAPYKVSSILTTVAEEHSVYMRDHGCFDHQCPGELSVAERACAAGYGSYCWGSCFIGETIAAGYPDPASIVAAWLASPGHREILLHGDLREIGVSYVAGGSWGHYWTADLGSQPDVLPMFINYDDLETESRQVTLTMTNENVSGCSGIDYADEVMISNVPGFAGAEWKPYTLHKSWTLSEGDGVKTVYVKYRDATGYQVTFTDDILLSEPLQYELAVGSRALTFFYEIGSGFASPTAVGVMVENAASGSPMAWSAECASGTWSAINPDGGTTPDRLTVSVDGFQATAPGTFQDTVTVTSPQDPDNPQQVTVTVLAVEKVYRVMLPYVSRAGD